jgi:dimethylhistidine N-methyltransferase
VTTSVVPARTPRPMLDTSDFARDMAACLGGRPHEISPKYFYDERGSRLFDRICELPEYYVTRTELGIFQRDIAGMAAAIGPDAEVIEFGAGSLTKARLLLRALQRPRRYVAVDISAEHLHAATASLQQEFPEVEIIPVVGDFTNMAGLPTLPLPRPGNRRIGFFPGSTLGNLGLADARRFLSDASTLLAGGGLLIGIDLVKLPAVLHSAYNDAAGVTAAFNRNLLARANRELGTDFDVDAYAHHAFYHPGLQRIEMHLVCMTAQRVRLGEREFEIRAGDSLHTENSQKYTLEGFRSLAAASGFSPAAVWCDPQQLFSVHWLVSDQQRESNSPHHLENP